MAERSQRQARFVVVVVVACASYFPDQASRRPRFLARPVPSK